MEYRTVADPHGGCFRALVVLLLVGIACAGCGAHNSIQSTSCTPPYVASGAARSVSWPCGSDTPIRAPMLRLKIGQRFEVASVAPTVFPVPWPSSSAVRLVSDRSGSGQYAAGRSGHVLLVTKSPFCGSPSHSRKTYRPSAHTKKNTRLHPQKGTCVVLRIVVR